MVRNGGTFVLSACLVAASALFAAEPAPQAVSPGTLIPDDAILALQISGRDGTLSKALVGSDFAKLWQEPEVQAFAGPAWAEFKAFYAEQVKQSPFLPSIDDLLEVFCGDLALSVSAPAGPVPLPRVCVAVRMADAERAGRLLRAFTQGAKPEEGKVIEAGPMLSLVLEKGMLLAANGPEALAGLRSRLQDPKGGLASSADEQALRKLFGAEGDGFAHASLHVPRLLETLAKAAPGEAKELAALKAFLAKSGLDGLRAIGLRLGQRGEVLTLDSALRVEGEPKGLLAEMLAIQPLPADVLRGVPADAVFCSAGRINLGRSLATLRGLLAAEQVLEFNQTLAELKQLLGVDIEKELLPSLGESWALYDIGGQELLGSLPGFALSLAVKDEAAATLAVRKIVNALTEQLAKEMGPLGPKWAPRDTKIGDQQVYYVNLAPVPIAPALAIRKGRLLVAPSVSSMRNALKALDSGSTLAGSPEFKAALERVTGAPLDPNALPAQFSYTAGQKDQTPLNGIGGMGQMVFFGFRQTIEMRRMWGGGVSPDEEAALKILDKLDFALFPSLDALRPHLKPSASALVKAEGGLVTRTDLAIPSPKTIATGQSVFFGGAMLAAIAVPNMLRSRMAANESAAIAACKTFAEAEDIYRRTDWDADGVLEYAQTITGDNSLYEKTAGQGDLTLVDQAFARAEVKVKAVETAKPPEPTEADKTQLAKHLKELSAEDYPTRENAAKAIQAMGPRVITLLEAEAKKTEEMEVRGRCSEIAKGLRASLDVKSDLDIAGAQPKAGYIFMVMTGQGTDAPGGKKSYVVPGAGASGNNMTLGYAIVAFPAQYDKTGRNTFIINNTGTVYQKDLGAETLELVKKMDGYNPDQTWVVSE